MEHRTPGRCTPQPWESGRGGKGYCTQLWAPPSFKHTVEESCQSFFLSSHAWRKQAPSRKASLCQTKVPLSHAEKKGRKPLPTPSSGPAPAPRPPPSPPLCQMMSHLKFEQG